MGCIKTITFETFPEQGSRIGKEVRVCYHYDTSKIHKGIIVRDDIEEPYETIIHIPELNRYVNAMECQYS